MGIKFGFSIPTLTAFPRASEAEVKGGTRLRFERSYEICQLAEDLGYDFGTVGQHRFTPDTIDSPSPLVLLAALAARTSALRLCTNILLLPAAYHPVEIAEQSAMVDEISDGRLILGIGLGYRPYEFEGVGLDYKSRVGRLEEGVEVLRKAWSGSRIEFHGKYFDVNGVDVMPKPIQRGGPPIWIGAIAPPAIARAARIGDGWLTDNIQTLGALTPQIERYREDARRAGRPGTVAMVRKVGVGKTRRLIEEEWLPDILDAYRQYLKIGVLFEDKEFEEKLRSGKPMTLSDFPPDQFIAGSVEDCIEAVREIQDKSGSDYIVADFGRAAHGPAYDRVRAAVELFGREVMPEFQ